MRRGRPVALNPTLLEGSPRNAAGEFAAGANLAENDDAHIAVHAACQVWKELGCRVAELPFLIICALTGLTRVRSSGGSRGSWRVLEKARSLSC